ncbi:hypothetical protein HMPREF3191_01601 [Veillonellaceae bacterium DNF00626]|nr:hypothetical protein HMPREF3191_01601 [Veillonellaceae bacterium DNF00626]
MNRVDETYKIGSHGKYFRESRFFVEKMFYKNMMSRKSLWG